MASPSKLTYSSLIIPIQEASPETSPPPSNPDHPIPNILCSNCKLLYPDFSSPKTTTHRTPYHLNDTFPDFPALKHRHEEEGCSFCGLLRWCIRREWGRGRMEERTVGALDVKDGHWREIFERRWDGQVEVTGTSFLVESGNSEYGRGDVRLRVGRLMVDCGPAVEEGAGYRYERIEQRVDFKVYECDDDDGGGTRSEGRRRIGLKRPSDDALSNGNVELYAKWIDECKTSDSHEACRQNLATLPTRVIDVGPLDGSLEPILVISGGRKGRFAALSHCWGPASVVAMQLKTLTGNLEEMLKSIPVADMPPNFRDAVLVTRKLDLRYLWIDSLCIVQNSRSDWEAEAAKMNAVYTAAEVVISATGASSSQDGFLQRNKDGPLIKMTVSRPETPTDTISYYIAPSSDGDLGGWSDDIEGSTWNERAWTFQERYLPSRILHFCKTKTYFECRCGTASEEGECSRGIQGLSPKVIRDSTTVSEDVTMKLYHKWHNIAHEVSKRKLTYTTDKLPAMSGIASQVSKLLHHNDEYVAGIWRGDLIRSLLWSVPYCPRIKQDTSLPPAYIGPSWSWISSIYPIDFHSVLRKPSTKSDHPVSECQIKTLKMKLLGSDPFGQISSGSFIKLRARMGRITALQECDYESRWYTGERKFPYDLLIEKKGKVGEGILDLDDLGVIRGQLWYLEVHSQRRPSGLLLEEMGRADGKEEEEEEFRRVGVVASTNARAEGFSDAFEDGLVVRSVVLI